jgi:8-amino-7-oxononanoate synthase
MQTIKLASTPTNIEDQHLSDSLKSNVTILKKTHSSQPFEQHPGFLKVNALRQYAQITDTANPFFTVHDSIANATTSIDGKDLYNFASYNYLGLNGHPSVTAAAKAAIDQFGTSVSASRIVSGERPFHQALENALASLCDCEAALTYVSGHATNVTALGYLFGPDDLIMHDKLAHNSILQGIRLSQADRIGFKHNDLEDLENRLKRVRHKYKNVLIVVEGLYSMDGDIPDLPVLVQIKEKWGCLLMVDDAHGLGVLGQKGLGIREHFNLKGSCVDIWTGTLSKTLASSGGYIAGSQALIDNLKFFSPGFLYSVGLPPPNAAAALAALKILHQEPQRVMKLQAIGKYFLERTSEIEMDTGHAIGFGIIPAILGCPLKAITISSTLKSRGIHAMPIFYPAVAEHSARIRFFLSCEHTMQMVDQTIEAWNIAITQLNSD